MKSIRFIKVFIVVLVSVLSVKTELSSDPLPPFANNSSPKEGLSQTSREFVVAKDQAPSPVQLLAELGVVASSNQTMSSEQQREASAPLNPLLPPSIALISEPQVQTESVDLSAVTSQIIVPKTSEGNRSVFKRDRIRGLRKSGPKLVNARQSRTEHEGKNYVSIDKKRTMSELDQIKLENSKLEREIQSLLSGEFGLPSAIEDHELFKFVFPPFARPIDKDSFCSAMATFATADWGYNDDRKVTDLANLVYGPNITVQDISLLSRLARNSSEKDTATTWKAKLPRYLMSNVSELGTVSAGQEAQVFTGGQVLAAYTDANALFTKIIQGDSEAKVATESIFKLAKKINDTSKLENHYLNRIADQELKFKSSYKRLALDLYFSNNWLSNLYALVFCIPIVFVSQKMSLDTELPSSKITELNEKAVTDTAKFFEKYPAGLRDFFQAFLKRQNIDLDERCNQFGIGDISLAVNRKMHVRELDLRGVVGLQVTAPTSVKVNNRQLWPAILGNGGFWEFSAHIAGYSSLSGFANPHFFAQVKFPLPATRELRVAKMVSRKGSQTYTTDNERSHNFAFGEDFIFLNSADWSHPETSVPLLAKEPLQTIDINKGCTFVLQVGTLLKDFITRDFSLDLSYKLVYKNSDSAGFKSRDANYDVAKLFERTRQQEHSVGFTLCWRYQKELQFEMAVSKVILGQNVPQSTYLSLNAHYNF